MNPPTSLPDAVCVEHEAMNTIFSLRFRGLDPTNASGMATECIHEIDRIEGCLSRFRESSDIARVNQLAAGETLYLSETTHQCLLLALDAYVKTGGLFDVTQGARIEHRKARGDGPAPAAEGRLIIHPDVPAVTCETPGRILDLGGIGKGFALDQLRNFLTDWGAEDVLLTAGASSMLAWGPTTWPVELAGGRDPLRIALSDSALSVSGTGIQGSHIVHPCGDDAVPGQTCGRVWVTAGTAALAEVWSTALMLVPLEEIAGFIDGEVGVSSVYAEREGAVTRLGRGRS